MTPAPDWSLPNSPRLERGFFFESPSQGCMLFPEGRIIQSHRRDTTMPTGTMNKGWGLALMDQIQNENTAHQSVVGRIEKITGRSTIGYFTHFQHPAGLIAEHDIALLETVLRSVDINTHNGKLDLILDSPGGSPVGAEKIILTCRSFCKEFRVIVPRSAMSAATLVCMGADQIVMSDTSEIGPIDPQMEITTREGTSTRPAASHVEPIVTS